MDYAELHVKTNFSFLEGASHADELMERAAELGYRAVAVTDRNSVAGIVRAHAAAKEVQLPLVVGAELHLQDGPPVIVWVPDRAAYGQLARLLTVGRRRAPKGTCELHWDDLAQHASGMIAAVQIPAWDETPTAVLLEQAARWKDYLPARTYLLVELHRQVTDDQQLERLQAISHATGWPLLAAGDVHYHVAQRMALHEVVTAIRLGTTVDQLGGERFTNAQRHLRSMDEIQAIYRRVPAAIERTLEIAGMCHFSLDELRYEYPEELAPQGMTPFAYLRDLTWRGAHKRYPAGIPDKVKGLVQHELELIEELKYEAYFLTVWDLVRFARQQEILCQGRGSAANSAVCYCLGITAVDPDRMDVLFERFVSRERNEAPDIDVDFEHERREEVLQYLYNKYGRERAGMTAEVITYRIRSAIRDVGKALGYRLEEVDALAKQVEGYHRETNLDERCRQVGIDPETELGRRLLYVINDLVGFPRHLSQHVGGMVMTRGPLCELVPIENASMENRTVISWDKNDLDTLGILKVDCLALGMLSAIRRCFDLIRQQTGQDWTLATVPAEDPRVYDMICRADTMGVFQIESRAQMSMLPRLQPRCYYDLVIEVAIVRPGPIQGQMVHPYLRRRAGDEEVEYASDAIREVLQKTMGVPIFQEQAMRLAVVAAGFTPGEADQLRRAMGAWRRPGVIDQFHQKLVAGMLSNGLTEEFAEQVFQQIRGFGEYGFPESHAASFALLVYVSAWLKCHYPAAFAAALINSQPMGFYAPAQLIRDAQDHGVKVLPLDVNSSDWDCTLTRDPPWGLRLGLRLIVGLSQRHVHQLLAAREERSFVSHEDFANRTGVGRAVMARFAQADALASLGRDRRQALWETLGQEARPRDLPLFASLTAEDEAPVALPELQPLENVLADYQSTGLSLKAHPISFFRKGLAAKRIWRAADLLRGRNGQLVRVAGLVLLRQRPGTAKGITFVTLEDETGTVNLVVHATTWQKYYEVARRSAAWVAFGKLEMKHGVIHVVTRRLEDFAKFLELSAADALQSKSRDFR